MEYYASYQEKLASYEAFQQYLRDQQLLPVNERMLNEFFNKDLYLNTQPIIPATESINMVSEGQIFYNNTQLFYINDIFNFFGGDNYPIGRAWKRFCVFYKTKFNQGLIDTIEDIKTEYGIP